MSNLPDEMSCGHCSFITQNIGDLEKHLEAKHNNSEKEKVQCPECDFSTNNQRNLKRHISNRHNTAKEDPDLPVKCGQCDFSCASPKGLAAHRRVHSLQPFMSKGFEAQKNSNPEDEVTEERPTPNSGQKLKESSKADSKNKSTWKLAASGSSDILKVCIRCSMCEFMCNSLRSMAEHIEVVHSTDSESPVDDSDVDDNDHGEELEDKDEETGSENNEMLEDINKFKCPSCSANYYQKWKLTRHLKAHPEHLKSHDRMEEEGDSMLEDEAPVNRSENQHLEDSNVNENETSEKPERPEFTCNFCFRVFSSSSNRNRHVSQKHRNEDISGAGNKMADEKVSRPSQSLVEVTPPQPEVSVKRFECEICGSKFTRRFSLKQHQLKQHSDQGRQEMESEIEGVEVIEETSEVNPCCPVCGKDFISEDDLQRHIRRRHSNEAKTADGDKSDNTVYSCKVCGEKVIGKSNFESHNKKYHLNHKRQIAFTGSDVDDDELKPKHSKGISDHDKKILDCSLCDAKLSSKSSLLRHRKNVHG